MRSKDSYLIGESYRPSRRRWRCFITGLVLGAIPAFVGGFVVNYILAQRFGL